MSIAVAVAVAVSGRVVSSRLFACDDDSVDERERKAAIRYLRDLLNEWDPIGGCHVPPDEYDCLIGPLLSKLCACF